MDGGFLSWSWRRPVGTGLGAQAIFIYTAACARATDGRVNFVACCAQRPW